MTDVYKVVTSVKEIATLNDRLADQLARTFLYAEKREITYPAGHHRGNVFFETSTGTDVRAWSPVKRKDRLLNFLLSGQPGSTKWMEISVQLNFPADSYNRRMAGAFVTDETGAVFVAHRGKLTKGNAGLKKAKVLREFSSRVIEASDGKQTSRLILIGALDDEDLADRLWRFALEAREVATKLGQESDDESQDRTPPNSLPVHRSATTISPAQRLLKLRSYFDEYAGETTSKGHGGGRRTVQHGDIVKALELHLRDKGESQKAQAIDLALINSKEVNLYEVKTSARTTDVYTGVGQLIIHGECIRELLKLPVQRFLVLPKNPKEEHARQIRTKTDLKIITYIKSLEGYAFEGL